MANFKTHSVVATIVSGTVSTALMLGGFVSASESVMLLFAGIIGGSLPDIDADHSKPLDIAFAFASTLFAFLISFSQPYFHTVVEIMVIWFAAFLFMRLMVLSLFQRITVHRGLFHSIPAALLSGILVIYLLYYLLNLDRELAWLSGVMITIGYLTHLLLDELYSVNLFGIQLKRSFGTAFKLYTKSEPVKSVALYLLTVVAFIGAPEGDQFWQWLIVRGGELQIIDMLYPIDNWFKIE